MNLQGKVAVITGGSRGLGEATAIKLASLGAHIALIDRSTPEKAQEVCDRIASEFGVRALPYGKKNMEAHMQNRKLIADWCYEKGLADNVIEKKVRDGKTYFVVNDFEALRGLFGDLLAEVQRIKSEGDYEAGKALVENYAVNIDPELHKEVLERYASLGLKPYGGFLNPEIVPVEKNGEVVDYEVVYSDSYLGQMLEYGKKYATL